MEAIENFFQDMEAIHIGGFSLMGLMSTLLLLVICVLVRRVIMRLFKKAISKSRLDEAIKGFLNAALGVVLWVLVVLIVADKLGIPMTSLVAVLSVVSLALSLSVQNILTNLFSGITILGTHPFSAGDWVDIGGTAGTVKSVGLFYTNIAMPDGRDVRIPNSTVADSKVENFTAHENRRIDIDICASYDDSIYAVKRAIARAFELTEGLIFDPEPIVAVKEYGDSAIKYMILVWVRKEIYFAAKCALMENLRLAFDETGVRMTYPHLNVHLDPPGDSDPEK